MTGMETIDEQEELDTPLQSSVYHTTSVSTDSRSTTWTDPSIKATSPIRLSFYNPNKLRNQQRENSRNKDSLSDSVVNTAQSTDLLGVAAETYNSLDSWKKLKLYEFIFCFILVISCYYRSDLIGLLILYVIFAHGCTSALMIPHYCYSLILCLTAFSMVCRYIIQLPFFRQCVDNDGYYYLTVLVLYFIILFDL